MSSNNDFRRRRIVDEMIEQVVREAKMSLRTTARQEDPLARYLRNVEEAFVFKFHMNVHFDLMMENTDTYWLAAHWVRDKGLSILKERLEHPTLDGLRKACHRIGARIGAPIRRNWARHNAPGAVGLE